MSTGHLKSPRRLTSGPICEALLERFSWSRKTHPEMYVYWEPGLSKRREEAEDSHSPPVCVYTATSWCTHAPATMLPMLRWTVSSNFEAKSTFFSYAAFGRYFVVVMREDNVQFLPCKCVCGPSGSKREAEAWANLLVPVHLLLGSQQSPLFNTSSSLQRS